MEDCEILNLYFQRSEDALTETRQKFGGVCSSVAYKILRSPQDAEECLNDVLLRAWNSIPPNKPLPMLPYLAKIARNLALDRYEYRSAQKRNPVLEEAYEELEGCIAATGSVEDSLRDQELAHLISVFLRTLRQDARMLFVRRYWYGDSIAELCGTFDMTQSKVKSSLFRTRERLKDHLAKEGIFV